MEILAHDLVFLTLVQYLPLEFDHLKSLIMQEGVCYDQGIKRNRKIGENRLPCFIQYYLCRDQFFTRLLKKGGGVFS